MPVTEQFQFEQYWAQLKKVHSTVRVRYPDESGYQIVYFSYNRTGYGYWITKFEYQTLYSSC
jgi:hypothetical protein